MRTVAFIPARGGSKGIPRKNLQEVGGKPLIAHVIQAAVMAAEISAIWVSTDDEEIAEVARENMASVQWRPAVLASDEAKTESAMLYFLQEHTEFDKMVLLQPTSPLTTHDDIDEAITMTYPDREGYDSVVSVCEDHGGWHCGGFDWHEPGKRGAEPMYDIADRPRRQDLPPVYRENGAIYVNDVESILKDECRLSGKVGLYVMPQTRSFEIDSPEDLETIRKVYE